MSELIAWGIGVGIIALMFWAIVRERKRIASRSLEEYERDLEKGRGTAASMMRAGMIDLDKMLKAEVREAEEALQDQQAGRMKAEKKPGDGTPPSSDLIN